MERYALVAASYVVLRRAERQVLLTRRLGTGWMDGWWSLPAGHVEWGESCVEAAIREAEEEIGVRIAPADLVPLCAVHRTAPPHDPVDERVDFFFAAERWDGEPSIREPERSDGLRWYALDNLPSPVVTPVDDVLSALAAGAGTVPSVMVVGFEPPQARAGPDPMG